MLLFAGVDTNIFLGVNGALHVIKQNYCYCNSKYMKRVTGHLEIPYSFFIIFLPFVNLKNVKWSKWYLYINNNII